MNFKHYIERERFNKLEGISIVHMAKELDISPTTLTKILQGRAVLKSILASKLARRYNLTLEEVLTFSDCSPVVFERMKPQKFREGPTTALLIDFKPYSKAYNILTLEDTNTGYKYYKKIAVKGKESRKLCKVSRVDVDKASYSEIQALYVPYKVFFYIDIKATDQTLDIKLTDCYTKESKNEL